MDREEFNEAALEFSVGLKWGDRGGVDMPRDEIRAATGRKPHDWNNRVPPPKQDEGADVLHALGR